jgi:hypothetical protein
MDMSDDEQHRRLMAAGPEGARARARALAIEKVVRGPNPIPPFPFVMDGKTAFALDRPHAPKGARDPLSPESLPLSLASFLLLKKVPPPFVAAEVTRRTPLLINFLERSHRLSEVCKHPTQSVLMISRNALDTWWFAEGYRAFLGPDGLAIASMSDDAGAPKSS